jgi:hypothetical protein
MEPCKNADKLAQQKLDTGHPKQAPVPIHFAHVRANKPGSLHNLHKRNNMGKDKRS